MIWREICENPRFVYFGAEAGGRLVASCTVTIVPNLTAFGRPYGLIENVVTEPAFRCHGHGAAVVRAAVTRCEREHCYKVMLLSAKRREDAHRFYASLGFDPDSKQGFQLRLP